MTMTMTMHDNDNDNDNDNITCRKLLSWLLPEVAQKRIKFQKLHARLNQWQSRSGEDDNDDILF